MSEASSSKSDGARCGECQTPQIDGARFCFDCGAALAPPPSCPQCDEEVPPEAKFCPGCGAKLIGPRPLQEEATEAPVVPPDVAASEAIKKAAAELPPPKPASSGIMGNVMLFIAILAVVLVAIYAMNKDSKKEHNPFDGPAPMAGGGAAEAPAAPPAPPAAVKNGAPIRGTVDVAPELKDSAQGTLYMVVRQAGSANRGPPLAVFKADSPTFPAAFEIGAAQVMMPNMPFNGPFDVYARLDRDGNAMTKEAGDLHSAAPLTQVAAGTADLKVVLDKRL